MRGGTGDAERAADVRAPILLSLRERTVTPTCFTPPLCGGDGSPSAIEQEPSNFLT
jgi:hypothetical protein